MEKNEQNIIEILCEELNIKKWQAEKHKPQLIHRSLTKIGMYP